MRGRGWLMIACALLVAASLPARAQDGRRF
jgi:hypothetical protein